MTVTVIIADDQPVIREGLRSLLAMFDDVEVLGVAATAERALDLVAEHDPDVLLTDLRMPGIGGAEGIRQLVAGGFRTKAVALTTYDDETTIVGALNAGAVGFLVKDADPESIRHALVAAASGRSLLDAGVIRAVLNSGNDSHASSPAEDTVLLTDRELEVLVLIAQGLSNREIAAQLVVGVSTVKTHVNHILAKTDCRDRAALVAYAYQHRLV